MLASDLSNVRSVSVSDLYNEHTVQYASLQFTQRIRSIMASKLYNVRQERKGRREEYNVAAWEVTLTRLYNEQGQNLEVKVLFLPIYLNKEISMCSYIYTHAVLLTVTLHRQTCVCSLYIYSSRAIHKVICTKEQCCKIWLNIPFVF